LSLQPRIRIRDIPEKIVRPVRIQRLLIPRTRPAQLPFELSEASVLHDENPLLPIFSTDRELTVHDDDGWAIGKSDITLIWSLILDSQGPPIRTI